MYKFYRNIAVLMFISSLFFAGCNFFEPFSRAFNEDEAEVELYEAQLALDHGDYNDAYDRWSKVVAQSPYNTGYKVKLGETIVGLSGIDYLDIFNRLDVSANSGQTKSLFDIAPVNKDLVRLYDGIKMIEAGSDKGDKGNAGFGYALMAAGKLLATFDASYPNGDRTLDTGEISDASLWTSTTDYDKDGKSDFNGKTMGQQIEDDLKSSLTLLETAISVDIHHVDAKQTTKADNTAIFIQKEFVDAYNAIRVTYSYVVDINTQIANQALSGSALATLIEGLDN